MAGELHATRLMASSSLAASSQSHVEGPATLQSHVESSTLQSHVEGFPPSSSLLEEENGAAGNAKR